MTALQIIFGSITTIAFIIFLYYSLKLYLNHINPSVMEIIEKQSMKKVGMNGYMQETIVEYDIITYKKTYKNGKVEIYTESTKP
jgi:hypothetical protein